jgi:hypothetical protein
MYDLGRSRFTPENQFARLTKNIRCDALNQGLPGASPEVNVM